MIHLKRVNSTNPSALMLNMELTHLLIELRERTLNRDLQGCLLDRQ